MNQIALALPAISDWADYAYQAFAEHAKGCRACAPAWAGRVVSNSGQLTHFYGQMCEIGSDLSAHAEVLSEIAVGPRREG